MKITLANAEAAQEREVVFVQNNFEHKILVAKAEQDRCNAITAAALAKENENKKKIYNGSIRFRNAFNFVIIPHNCSDKKQSRKEKSQPRNSRIEI